MIYTSKFNLLCKIGKLLQEYLLSHRKDNIEHLKCPKAKVKINIIIINYHTQKTKVEILI